MTGIHLVPATFDISGLPGNYCLIGFAAHAGAGVASDAAFTWLADAGVQVCCIPTVVPSGFTLAVLPVHFAWQAFMSLPDIFSEPHAAVKASGEKDAREATPTGCTLTAAALPLHAEAHGAIAHSGGQGVQVCAFALATAKAEAKKKIIKRFFITNRLVSE